MGSHLPSIGNLFGEYVWYFFIQGPRARKSSKPWRQAQGIPMDDDQWPRHLMHELGGVLEQVLLQIEAGVNKEPDSPATHYVYHNRMYIYILIYVQICYLFLFMRFVMIHVFLCQFEVHEASWNRVSQTEHGDSSLAAAFRLYQWGYWRPTGVITTMRA